MSLSYGVELDPYWVCKRLQQVVPNKIKAALTARCNLEREEDLDPDIHFDLVLQRLDWEVILQALPAFEGLKVLSDSYYGLRIAIEVPVYDANGQPLPLVPTTDLQQRFQPFLTFLGLSDDGFEFF